MDTNITQMYFHIVKTEIELHLALMLKQIKFYSHHWRLLFFFKSIWFLFLFLFIILIKKTIEHLFSTKSNQFVFKNKQTTSIHHTSLIIKLLF